MIKINGRVAELGSFPDGTLLIKENVDTKKVEITWHYENDREFLALIYLVRHMQSHGIDCINLFMPYIPNARQDRVKNNEDVFTLKYFSELLNSLGLHQVTVLDPHSNVSTALIDRIVVREPVEYVQKALSQIIGMEGSEPTMFYPDEGAGKRYSGMVNLPYAFGIKKRDWKTGQIQGLEVAGNACGIAGKNILIVDDICARGGTFLHSARKLKELGAGNIYLYISHCENTILSGELIDSGLLRRIYTTDSIFTGRHELIEVFPL